MRDIVYSLAVYMYICWCKWLHASRRQNVFFTWKRRQMKPLWRKNYVGIQRIWVTKTENEKRECYENTFEISCCVWQSLFMFVFCEHSWIIDQFSQQMRPNTGLPHAFNMHAIRTKLIYKTAAIELHSFAFFSIIEFRKSKDHPEYHRVVN